MNRHHTYFLIVVLWLLLWSFVANAQTTYYNNQYGLPQGSAQTYGNTTYYTDQYGRQQGSAQTYGNTTYYYDQYGRQQGSAQTYGNAYGTTQQTQPTWDPYLQVK